MNTITRERLNAVNRKFYAANAEAFDASRNHPWPGWQRSIRGIESTRAGSTLRVLDAGCGNGRFATFLQHNTGAARGDSLALDYIGVDQSRSLLSIASASHVDDDASGLEWLESDILAGNPRSTLPPGPFDLVVAFGLIHHVPGFEQRRALLAALAERIEARGRLVFTVWQFRRSKRFDRHIVAWEQYNAQSPDPIITDELESGDFLLSFGDKNGAPRYCHDCDESEFDQLVSATGLRLMDDFEADGRSGDLNRYAVLQRVP